MRLVAVYIFTIQEAAASHDAAKHSKVQQNRRWPVQQSMDAE